MKLNNKKAGSISILRYVFMPLSVLFFLAITMSIFVDITWNSGSSDEELFIHIDPDLSESSTGHSSSILIERNSSYNKLILYTKGCKIKKTPGNNVSSLGHPLEENVKKIKCASALTSLNNNEELHFKLHDSYRDLNCCSSYWTSFTSFKHRTVCKPINHTESMMGKEFIKVKCCYKWMKMISTCQRDIHANIPVNSIVQKKVAFWEKRMPNLIRIAPSVLIIRFRITKLHQNTDNFMDLDNLARFGFVPMRVIHRRSKSCWPFYTKFIGKQGIQTHNQTRIKNTKINSSVSSLKKSLVSLFSSINNYVTFSIVGNRSLLGELDKQKFDYDFAKFVQSVKEDCIGKLSLQEYALNYSARLIGKFPRTPFFGSIFLSDPTETSNDLVTTFLRSILFVNSHIKDKTVIVLMEDPKLRNKQPSQLLIRVPDFMIQNDPYIRKTLNVNRNRLVTSSDLHQSLIEIFKMGWYSRKFNETGYRRECSHEIKKIPKGYDLLRSIIPDRRTCVSAGIKRHDCPCQDL